ncbi:PX domain-containing protein EREX-like [Vitis riparia]|uniref:PX domain-containing protein EREX-like n=1 Tax=Vitis riparia TaxID=96939 RepID=UPI00155A1A8E|nr:PX domain-containing protein EREX-like [Vitis riparia]
MNLYAHDLTLLDFNINFSDPVFDSLTRPSQRSSPDSISADGNSPVSNPSPPRYRHDGSSPLPLGMDWSPPPRKWDGQDSIWPHDPCTGWSYCVTIPSWVVIPKSRGSDPVVFYRVQVGIQSPEAITTTRTILRRFNDFLKLLSELQKAFPKKNLPPAPPKRLLRMKSRMLLEERRCALEDWMEKLLSDIDLSRSVLVATFLELEASVRSAFYDSNQQISDANASGSGMFPSLQLQPNSDYGSDTAYERSELGTPRFSDLGMENFTSDHDITGTIETAGKYGMSDNGSGTLVGDFILKSLERFSKHRMLLNRDNSVAEKDKVSEGTLRAANDHGGGMQLLSDVEDCKPAGHVRRLSTESVGSDVSSVRHSEISNLGVANSFGDGSTDILEGAEAPRTMDAPVKPDLQVSSDLVVALPSEEQHKMNRVLTTMRRRLAAARTDMEDLIARLNQEAAVRQYLTTKVKDLEVELETTKQNSKESLQQAVLIERERFTQTQWDIEDLRSKCLELELKLKSEQDEKLLIASTKASIIQENEMLLQELDVAREQFENLQKHQEESEAKSKADIKLLVKEVKSLRGSQSELKQELSKLMKEKIEVERVLQKEKQRREFVNSANTKLLHECEILRNRLQECSVNFLVEEEDKLIMDTSSPSDAIDLLTTSDNRIGLLLAEAQLLAQDVENALVAEGRSQNSNNGDTRTKDDELRKMLTDIFIDNATLRMQVNSVIRCALNNPDKSEQDEEEEEAPLRKTVLSKFLER